MIVSSCRGRELLQTLGARFAAVASLIAALMFGAQASAQTEASPFGGFKHDASQPIEVTADSLEVRNEQRVAVFRGDVNVRQGVMRMRADSIEISYAGQGDAATPSTSAIPGAGGSIDRLEAVGDVILSNGKEQAEAGRADYDVTSGTIVLTKNVMLAQGENVLAGEKLVIDLASGVGRMERVSENGRIRVLVTPSQNN